MRSQRVGMVRSRSRSYPWCLSQCFTRRVVFAPRVCSASNMSSLRTLLQASARTLSRTCARSSSLVLQVQGVHVARSRWVLVGAPVAHGAGVRVRSRARAPSHPHMFVLFLQADARTLPRTCARSSFLVLQAQGVHVSAQGSDVCAFVRRMVRVRAYARACVRPRTLTCLFCNAARWREILQGT